MKDFRLGNYEPVVSEIVAAEIEEDAPEKVQKQYAWLLDLNPEELEADDQVVELATTYLERDILTSNDLDKDFRNRTDQIETEEATSQATCERKKS